MYVQNQMSDDASRKRVAAFTIAIARVLGSSAPEIRTMARGAFLHEMASDSIPFTDSSDSVAAQHESYGRDGIPKGA